MSRNFANKRAKVLSHVRLGSVRLEKAEVDSPTESLVAARPGAIEQIPAMQFTADAREVPDDEGAAPPSPVNNDLPSCIAPISLLHVVFQLL